MTIYELLKTTGIPVAYGSFKSGQSLPYMVYTGTGQTVLPADNMYVYRQNTYQIEYYFITKNEENETAIENALLDGGFPYSKSEDVYIDDEGVYVIYYNI